MRRVTQTKLNEHKAKVLSYPQYGPIDLMITNNLNNLKIHYKIINIFKVVDTMLNCKDWNKYIELSGVDDFKFHIAVMINHFGETKMKEFVKTFSYKKVG